MTRILSRDEYRILSEHGYAFDAITKYGRGYAIPHRPRQLEIISILGRDPWNGAVAKGPGRPLKLQPLPVRDEDHPSCRVAVPAPPVPRAPVDPCVTDATCLAERQRVFRLPNNLSWGSPCVNCRAGRDRQMAAHVPERSPHDTRGVR